MDGDCALPTAGPIARGDASITNPDRANNKTAMPIWHRRFACFRVALNLAGREIIDLLIVVLSRQHSGDRAS